MSLLYIITMKNWMPYTIDGHRYVLSILEWSPSMNMVTYIFITRTAVWTYGRMYGPNCER